MKTSEETRVAFPDMTNDQIGAIKKFMEVLDIMPANMDDCYIECLGCGEKYPIQEHPHKCK
jgi:hypothetical protein